MANQTKRILIIGGAGFIGSHLSEQFLRLGNKIIIIDDFSDSALKKIDKSFKVYKTNIENLNKVRNIFKKEKPDIVYHLAGAINLRRQIKDPLFKNSLNILGRTEIILDCCRESKVKKIIFLSSGGAIYNDAKIIPTPEDYLVHPTSLYGLANLIIEKYTELYYKEYGLDYIILRLSNVYGPRQWKSGLIPAIIINLLKKKKPIIFGDGKQTRDFIYVDDVIEASIMAIKKGKTGIYNVGTGEENSMNEVFNTIRKILNSKIKPSYKNLIKGKPRRSVLDIKKIKREFSWQPKTNLKSGLSKTIECFKT